MKRGQTATEYLVIVAVVIIIAILVISILGDIPSLSNNVDKKTVDFALSTAPIGITDYVVSDYRTTLYVRNNNPDPVTITGIKLGGDICLGFIETTLATGKSAKVYCDNVFTDSSQSLTYDIELTYIDKNTNAQYTLFEGEKLIIEQTTDEYLSILDNNPLYNSSQSGCWNFPTSPTSICTCADLSKVETNLSTLQGDYVLENHIDFNRCAQVFGPTYDYTSGAGWDPIGSTAAAYTGTFDGQNFQVLNLYISSGSGLFGSIRNSSDAAVGLLKNIGVVNANVTGGASTAALVGYARGATVINSYATGSVSGSGNNIGLLIGYGYFGKVNDSFSHGSVYGGAYDTGGLVGDAQGMVIHNSYSTANVRGMNLWTGGLTGQSYSGQIYSSYATGDVIGTSYVGGLTTRVQTGAFYDSYATGDVTGASFVGGFISDGTSFTVSNVYATGKVTCSGSYCGGLIGGNTSGTITYLGQNTFLIRDDDSAVNCFGGSGSPTAGGNNSQCYGVTS